MVGTFNMYILNPEWLAKHKIISPGIEVNVETNLARPGFRFHFPSDSAVWSVSPDKIVVETTSPDTDCGNKVARVLQALPETPLFGIGNNGNYLARRDELASLHQHIRDFPLEESSNELSLLQHSFAATLTRNEDAVVNLQLAVKSNEIEVVYNAHTNLERLGDKANLAASAAESFLKDRAIFGDLSLQYFGATVTHDVLND